MGPAPRLSHAIHPPRVFSLRFPSVPSTRHAKRLNDVRSDRRERGVWREWDERLTGDMDRLPHSLAALGSSSSFLISWSNRSSSSFTGHSRRSLVSSLTPLVTGSAEGT